MLYLSGIILSFFLSLLLFTKKKKSQADTILALWLAIIGLHLYTFYLFFSHRHMDYPDLLVLGMSLPLTHGPFLYIYTRQQLSSQTFQWKQLLHFSPVLLSVLLFADFYSLPPEQKIEVFLQKGMGYKMQTQINLFAIYASGLIYTGLSFFRLLKYKKNIVHQFSNTDKINFDWLLYLIIWMAVIWIVVLFVKGDNWIFGAVALFVMWMGYFGIKQVQVFSQNTPELFLQTESLVQSEDPEIDKPKSEESPDARDQEESSENVKYQKSSLSEKEAFLIQERLNQLMADQKPYKNPDLTLNDLAKSLEVHPNQLSQVINSKEKKNFYELINDKRVEEFIKLISKPASQQFTMLTIAFDCGFNSKASFNRNFKKYTGLPPRDYLRHSLRM